MFTETQQQTYVLRMWRAEDGSLRILLQKPGEDRPEGFTTIDDLSHHLRSLLDGDDEADAQPSQTTTDGVNGPPAHRRVS